MARSKGPPGAARVIMKTMSEIPSSVGGMSKKRRMK
jgi:hypothetical protein